MLIALSKNGATYQVFAPNMDQAQVIDHTKGSEMNEKRNVMLESARIARGNVKDLKDLNATDFDTLLMPGGFGAAKNLSTFAFKGGDMTVLADVEKALRAFHNQKKIIGLCCISPVIVAKVFGAQGVTVTLGQKGDKWPYGGSIDAATSFGAKHQDKNLDEICHDPTHRIYTTPAYMKDDAKPHQVFEGISKMVNEISKTFKVKETKI